MGSQDSQQEHARHTSACLPSRKLWLRDGRTLRTSGGTRQGHEGLKTATQSQLERIGSRPFLTFKDSDIGAAYGDRGGNR